MNIRRMTIDDYDEIYKLWLRTPGMGLNTVDDSREGIEKYLCRNPNTCFIAEQDGEIIGVIMSGHDGRRGFIHHTAVKTTERGQGVGSALLEQAMNALRDEGINKVALVVFDKNEIGNQFWDKRGFTARDDLIYRNKNINPLTRIDT
ncbi:GNAT family N-acetyltransferase [Acetanaerobacterium elongatum]|uniref:Ribosomal protein S18 acetylase RimI n=1 Tax=Acetanaerobacterium elongatum TaxID=258515 RepID=A0A1H0EWA9_9FIRM|nr:GNAT family N-acetyltransferase [Acetanaerobacterium elongatum]SDN86623.1 Ribosomal protein S18 acetylase RimI [Acetanaerobacterium elongatum]